MRAHDSYLSKLLKLGDTVFYIPVFQRNYDWNTDNCQQLFSDLETIERQVVYSRVSASVIPLEMQMPLAESE